MILNDLDDLLDDKPAEFFIQYSQVTSSLGGKVTRFDSVAMPHPHVYIKRRLQ